jgi:transposase
VREFAKACGKLAKTDGIDAQILSLFAEKMEMYPSYQSSPEELILKDLVQRRRQLTEEIIREKNRLDKVGYEVIKENIANHLAQLKEHLKLMDQAIAASVSKLDQFQEKTKILTSMPGIGLTTASVLLAELPELGTLENKKIAALVGVAPMNKDSGTMQGYRKIMGGRISVRCSLYMAAVVAIRHNKAIKNFYQRLRAKGKPAKVAIVAAMRKMITMLNQMIKYQNEWKEITVQN